MRARPNRLPPAPPPLAPLGRRERSQLSRGRKEIDARLDLHGMTQTRAHRALSDFLQRAHLDGLTFVLVITGKGKMGAESERGVLRRQVPQWLSLPEFRTLVVGFEEAHIGHGGEGALYVRIRRVEDLERSERPHDSLPAGSASRSSRKSWSFDHSSAIGGTACEAGNAFTACRIRNMQTAQFEIQRE